MVGKCHSCSEERNRMKATERSEFRGMVVGGCGEVNCYG